MPGKLISNSSMYSRHGPIHTLISLNLIVDEPYSDFLRSEGIAQAIFLKQSVFKARKTNFALQSLYSTSYTLAECNLCCLAGNSPGLAFK